MNKPHLTSFSLIALILMAMTCQKPAPFMVAEYTELEIEPNPVVMKDGSGSFSVSIEIPPLNISKYDSIVFTFSATRLSSKVILGSASIIPDLESKYTTTHVNEQIDFNLEMSEESLPINVEMYLFRKDKSQSTRPVEIGELISKR